MSIRGLNFQTWTMRFTAGLGQKANDYALDPPSLDIATDVQFDEDGGLQTRHPYAALGSDTIDGGTVSDCRRIVEYDGELLLFTKDKLYSWSAQHSAWAEKGTHLAVKLDEATRFATGGEQVECDRAELDGSIVYAWREGTTVYVAAADKETGAILAAPTVVSTATRPRLVALETTILLFVATGGLGLVAYAIDPTDVAGSINAGGQLVFADPSFFDAVKIVGEDTAFVVATLSPTTSYGVATVTSGLSITGATKARTSEGPIAVACAPTGTHVQVIRLAGFNVEGDLIAVAGLADDTVDQVIGTHGDAEHVTAAFRSTQDNGEYRCYVFWSAGRSTDGIAGWGSASNWVDTGGTIGTAATFLLRLDIGSRAFDHDGRVYLWMVWGTAAGAYGHGGQLQNASFLYRDDGFLCAKSAWNRGGGFLTSGHLPGVQAVDTNAYAYCGTERAFFGSPSSGNFSGSRPRDVIATFDSNEARRTARIGRTLYIACGEGLLQYDGERLVEVGFHVWPWYFNLTQSGSSGLADGAYAYKLSYRSDNARAERDRSAAIRIEEHEVTSGPKTVSISDTIPLYVTHKPTVAVEVWRTPVNPTADAPYYLVTSSDPSDATNPNRYLASDPTAAFLDSVTDTLSDATAAERGQYPQDVTLPSLAPPAATLVLATSTRLFLAGVGGEPHRVWYSKHRGADEVAAFHGALVVDVPPHAGRITGLAYFQETPVVFCERGVFLLLGTDGLDNTGGGLNFVARQVQGDVGAVNQESIAVTERGVIFKSAKGWQLLTGGFSIEYIGGGVKDYDDEEPLAVTTVEAQHQVRILTSSRMLVLDTQGGQWFEWSVDDGVHACTWDGAHVYLASTGPKKQRTDYTGVDYGMDVEIAWWKPADLNGYVLVSKMQVHGEYRSSHRLRIRLARDHWKDGVGTYFQDKIWTVTPTVVGAREKVSLGPKIKQVEALKVRITATQQTEGQYASGHPLSSELDTFHLFAQARDIGADANGRTLQLVADGSGAGTFEDGEDAVFHFESGVTTVAHLIIAVATSDYWSVSGAGTINRALTVTIDGGADATEGAPDGEALKLTGLSFELGFTPGLNRRLPAAQKL